MDSISSAATTIDIIFFVFQFTYHVHYVQSPSETMEQINSSFCALITAITALSDILHNIDTQPRNPMASLPKELEMAAESCASDLSKLEGLLRSRQIESRSHIRSKMELYQKDVDGMQRTLRSLIGKLESFTLFCFWYGTFELKK